MIFTPTIRVYAFDTLVAETTRGAGAALDHGAAVRAHGGTPRFYAYDGSTEREITLTPDAPDHDRRRCRECRAKR